IRCNLPYIISHHRLAACEDYHKTRKCLCHIVKKRKTLLGFKLIRIRPESRRCPAVDAVQIARPCHFPCNELGKPFFLRGWFSLHPRNLMGMAFWHCMHNYLPSYSILKILLPRFALKNVPDTRWSKPPIETVGGRHTGDRFQICPQVERRSHSDNTANGLFTKPLPKEYLCHLKYLHIHSLRLLNTLFKRDVYNLIPLQCHHSAKLPFIYQLHCPHAVSACKDSVICCWTAASLKMSEDNVARLYAGLFLNFFGKKFSYAAEQDMAEGIFFSVFCYMPLNSFWRCAFRYNDDAESSARIRPFLNYIAYLINIKRFFRYE